jgi:GNAT superfamily N-acetyltransferase
VGKPVIAELQAGDFGRAKEIFQGLDIHLAVTAVLEGSVPAKVFVDDALHPRAALAWTMGRFHLAGKPAHPDFIRNLGKLFSEKIYPQGLAAGGGGFSLFWDEPGWESAIQSSILKDKHPLRTQREYYRFQKLRHDWRSLLPPDFRLAYVNSRLLEDRNLVNRERLEEELCSERESVAAFLEKSFGTCLIQGNTLAAWCLSEYNHRDRCEIGIETLEPFQRRGFATLTASALIEQALSRGIEEIGWHCYASNVPSGAAARKIGFEKTRDYPAFTAWFDEVENLAINGNFRLRAGKYQEALAWFEQAFAKGQAGDWAYWGAARCAAALGLEEAALGYLHQAVERGFRDLSLLLHAEHFQGLHGSQGWSALIERLEMHSG